METNAMLKKRQLNNKIFMRGTDLYLVGGNIESDIEVWDDVNAWGEDGITKQLFSYANVLLNDLSYFAGFALP